MENIDNLVFNEKPPFELPRGGSFVKDSLSSYQKKYYDDALQYAISKGNSNPEEFAKMISTSVNNITGKNNPFGELANKYEPGTIKDGIKYKNYISALDPISKRYNQYVVEQNSKQTEKDMYDNISSQQPSQNDVQQPDVQQLEQNFIDNNFEQPQQSINIPQGSPTSLNTRPDIYSKNYSDQQSQANNSINNLQAINPIQQFGCGGKMKYTSDDDLNSYNVGGLHETNPYGGIPQGTGSNGKMNTVEQDETSFEIDGQKFIFSNRIRL